MISVIIPTHGNINYLDECVTSVLNQECDFEFEILLGVDACKETVDHIKETPDIYDRIRCFHFVTRCGPYVIKNTLADIARHDTLIFFDSDDVMAEGALQRFKDNIGDSDFAKLNFIEFDTNKDNINPGGSVISGVAVGINYDKFIMVKGFYDWIYGADLEFSGRIIKRELNDAQVPGAFYYKRIHSNSLTEILKEDSMKKVYLGIVKKNREENNWNMPDNRITGDYLFL